MIPTRYLLYGLAHLWVWSDIPQRRERYACGVQRPLEEQQARWGDRTPVCACCWEHLESLRHEGRR